MAVLCCMAVTLALLLSAGNSLADVDQNQLADIVKEILNRFTDGSQLPMFSLAVSVPFNSKSNMYDVSKVTDRDDDVRSALRNCEVYTGQMVVAATVLKADVFTTCPNGRVQLPDVLTKCPKGVVTWADVQKRCPEAFGSRKADHAEYRTAQQLNSLVNKQNKKGLLVFYVYVSPCPDKCTNMEKRNTNILDLINPITQWSEYAVVFSKAFESDSTDVADLKKGLAVLGNYSPLRQGPPTPIGLKNIYRCDREGSQMHCTSCSTDGNVTPECVSNTTPQPGPSRPNVPSASGLKAGGGGGKE